jgi:hypothetical protein
MVVGRLRGKVPRTQTEMNLQAGERAAKAASTLNALRGGSEEKFEKPTTPVAEMEYHWDRFCHLAAQQYAGYLEKDRPGTIAAMMYASEKTRLPEWRIDQMQEHLHWWDEIEEPLD